MRAINNKGLQIIKQSEGLELIPYFCPAGKLSIGYGHVITHREPFSVMNGITEEQAEQLLKQDVEDTENQLAIACRKIPLNDNQWSALVSFCYNTGVQKFMRNPNGTYTHIYVFLKQGDYENAAEQFERWIYGGGKKLDGLVERRAKEKALFLESVNGDV